MKTTSRSPVVAEDTQTLSPEHHRRAAGTEHEAQLEGAYVDYDIHGLIGVRLIDASSRDRAAVEQQLGPLQRPLEREPDILLRFVERLPSPDLRYIEVHRSGFTDDSFILLGSKKRPVRARIPFDVIGRRPCEIVCETGIGRVPLLKPVLRLIALSKGYLPFHASAFEWNGTGVLVSGWSHGGKTSALLAFAAHGARYVGDDLVLLHENGEEMVGLPTPLSLSSWQLGQVPRVRQWVSQRRLLATDVVRWLDRVETRLAAESPRLSLRARVLRTILPQIQERLKVQVPLRSIFPEGVPLVAKPKKLFLMVSHQASTISVDKVDPQEIGDRMVHSLRYENLPLFGQYLAYRFSFPDRPNEFIEKADATERAFLRSALGGLEAYVVRHPYPVPLLELFDAMKPFCEHSPVFCPAGRS
jgi:hypothetical protein